MYSLALSLILISPRHELRDKVAEELKVAPVKVEWQKDLDQALGNDELKRFDVIILETDQVSEIGELKVLARNIPIILLHKNANHQVGLAAIREGASEYLTEEEMGSGTLFRVLRYCVERAKVEQALEASRALVFRSQKMEAIGRTLAGVVHDFRHFLQVIYGNCSLMKRMIDQPVLEEMVDEIRLAGDKANNIISNLMNFAEGKRPGHLMVDVNRVILEMAPLFKALMKPGQQLEHNLNTFPLLARLDSRLEQVLMNLVVNAVDALSTDQGKVIIETRYLHMDRSYTDGNMKLKPGSYVVIELSDNGSGIRPEAKERIFEPFFTTKSREHGTGLGLAVVFSTLKDWGGQLAVQSSTGLGTTFKLVLDCDLAPPELSASFESLQKVTLHEKDSLLRLQLRRDLLALGCEVSELPEAGEGLLIYELDEVAHPHGVMISEFSPILLKAVNKIDDGVKTLRTPFSRHELQRALATPKEMK